MSTVEIGNEHINVIVNAAVDYQAWVFVNGKYQYADLKNAKAIGQILRDENIRAVNDCYPDDDPLETYPFEFRVTLSRRNPIEVLKAIHYQDYHSCATNDWETTRAYYLLQAIKDAVIRKLPGYEDAKWGIDE